MNNKKAVAIFVSIVILWFLTIPLLHYLTKGWIASEWEVASKVGDAFGVINSLFSGLALLGVVYTIILQRKTLDQQKQAIDLQLKELEQTTALQRDSLDQQKQAIDLQLKELEQTAKQSTRTALIDSYARHIEWFYTERQKRIKDGKMSDSDFKALFGNIENDRSQYLSLVEEIKKDIMASR